jgi:hypothetical protein
MGKYTTQITLAQIWGYSELVRRGLIVEPPLIPSLYELGEITKRNISSKHKKIRVLEKTCSKA